MQAARRDAALDGGGPKAQHDQLPVRNDAVLPLGDPGDLPVTWSI
jgi:hypothetical protein